MGCSSAHRPLCALPICATIEEQLYRRFVIEVIATDLHISIRRKSANQQVPCCQSDDGSRVSIENNYYVLDLLILGVGTVPDAVSISIALLFTGDKRTPLKLSRHGLAGACSRTYTNRRSVCRKDPSHLPFPHSLVYGART